MNDNIHFSSTIIGTLIFILLFFLYKSKTNDSGKIKLHSIEIAIPFYASLLAGTISLFTRDIEFIFYLINIILLLLIITAVIVSRKHERPAFHFLKTISVSILFLITGYYFMSVLMVLTLLIIKLIIVLVIIAISIFFVSLMGSSSKDNERGGGWRHYENGEYSEYDGNGFKY